MMTAEELAEWRKRALGSGDLGSSCGQAMCDLVDKHLATANGKYTCEIRMPDDYTTALIKNTKILVRSWNPKVDVVRLWVPGVSPIEVKNGQYCVQPIPLTRSGRSVFLVECEMSQAHLPFLSIFLERRTKPDSFDLDREALWLGGGVPSSYERVRNVWIGELAVK